MGIEWISMGSNTFNAFAPFYNNITRTPEYLANTGAEVSTDSFYWANRLIGALADAHYTLCTSHIERYQNAVAYAGQRFLKETDRAFMYEKPEDVHGFLEEANQRMSDDLQKKTGEVLFKVLYEASMQMKNGFARSDA